MTTLGFRGVSAGVARFLLAIGVSVVAGVLVAGLVLPLVAGAGVMAKTASQDFENLPSSLVQPLLPQQTKIVTSDGKLLATIYSQNRQVVPIAQISPLLQKAVVAIEDSRFFEHNGVDLRGLARALVSNAQGGSVQGGSTLTQQYVKNVLVLTASTDDERAAAIARTPARKLREMRLALGLEKVWSKSQILEGYLNIAYFGDGAYGAEAAAERYFGVHASQLTLPQAATLAGIVQSPVSYDPLNNPNLSEKRRNVVLERMDQLHVISEDDYVKARVLPMAKTLHPKDPPNGCAASIAPYFCNYVVKTIKSDPFYGKTPADRAAFLSRGYTIRTTLDSQAQAYAQGVLNKKVPVTDKHGAAISVIQPGSGNILVMAQNRIWGIGKGNKFTTYNYNVERRTPPDKNGVQTSYNGVGFQTGSTFKPFVLAAALLDKIPVNTRIYAPNYVVPVGYQDCAGHDVGDPHDKVHNDEGGSGTYDMRTATWASVNTYFMLLEKQTGLCKPAQIAQSMGLHLPDGGPLNQIPTLTLGVNPISPLHMAEAYAVVRRPRHALHAAVDHLDHRSQQDHAQGAQAQLQTGAGPEDRRRRDRAARRRHRRPVQRTDRREGVDRPARRRQDGHDRQPRERLVLRLHPASGRRGVGGRPDGFRLREVGDAQHHHRRSPLQPGLRQQPARADVEVRHGVHEQEPAGDQVQPGRPVGHPRVHHEGPGRHRPPGRQGPEAALRRRLHTEAGRQAGRVAAAGRDRRPDEPEGRRLRRQRLDDHRLRQQRQAAADTAAASDDEPVAVRHPPTRRRHRPLTCGGLRRPAKPTVG